MKIRNGFVSNSSSSSFVLLGVKLSKAEFDALYDEEVYDFKLVKGLEYAGGEGTDTVIGLKETLYEEYGVEKGFAKGDFEKVEKLLRKQFGPDRELDIAVWFGMEAS